MKTKFGFDKMEWACWLILTTGIAVGYILMMFVKP
jgi:hypothetical protein